MYLASLALRAEVAAETAAGSRYISKSKVGNTDFALRTATALSDE